MHYVDSKSILSGTNSMNLYRGCTHGCIYCDSRSDVYNMDHHFEDIEVKRNALELLKRELIKRKPAMVGTGAMTDPYVPLEKRLCHVRKSLELIYRYGFGFTCITKSDLILRDLDIIRKINEKTKAVVQMTLTTSDDDLCRVIEPNVCATSRRVEVLETLRDNNIPTVVWLCPILPYINDTEDNLNSIIDSCIGAEVKGIVNFEMGLTLRKGNREYFYRKLDENFPELRQRYVRQFKDSYSIPSPNAKALERIFERRTAENGIMNDADSIFSYIREFPSKTVQSKLL